MNASRKILLAAGLSLVTSACSASIDSNQNGKLTAYVVEASGGA